MKSLSRLFGALCIALPMASHAAISLTLAPNYDETRTTAYPNGDKPIAGCTPPTGYTEANVGDGGGEICEQSITEFDFNVSGSNNATDAHIAYKDAGAADVQIEARITDTFAGSAENFASVGVGIREAATQASWLFQCHSLQSGATAIQCRYGDSGSYTTVNCASDQIRPRYVAVTYDVSSTEIKGFESSDGSTWLECASTTRGLSDALGYMVGASKSATETTQVTIDNFSLGTTIDAYTPSDPPGGSPPVLVSSIPNQTGTQGEAFSLTFSAYFTGATSYSTTAFPGSSGLSESSDGVVSGTPSASDVSASPYSEDLCATNADGTTCDTVQFSFAPSSGSSSTFTVPDVGDTTSSTFNCSTTGGANGASWSSVLSSGSNTRPQPGDTILITSGERGNTEFRDCHGSSSSPITIKKTASATRLQINASGADGLLFRNTSNVIADFTVNWTGQTAGCGWVAGTSESPLTDCGLLVVGTSQHGVKLRGQRGPNVTIKGIEIDGNWSGSGGGGMDVGFSPNDQSYCLSTVPADYANLAAYYNGVEYIDTLTASDMYIHDIGKEAMYFGPNVDYGSCGDVPGQTNVGNVPRIKDGVIARVYIDTAGYDGINCKSGIKGTTDGQACLIEEVYVTTIGMGIEASGANSVAIACFESECTVRNSKVRITSSPPGAANGVTCSGNKAPSQWETAAGGPLECILENLDVSDTDGNCISIGRNAGMAAARSVDIHNNTLTDCGGNSVNIAQRVAENGGGGTVRDNLPTKSVSVPAGVTNANNAVCTESTTCGFEDHAANDYRIDATSTGHDSAGQCIDEDLLGTSRPQGADCDRGAYEFDE